MSEWIALSAVPAWLNERYGAEGLEHAGWSDIGRVLAEALANGSVAFRAEKPRRPIRIGTCDCVNVIDTARNTITLLETWHEAGMPLPFRRYKHFVGAEVEYGSLAVYCGALLGPSGAGIAPERKDSPKPRMGANELADWICACPTENSKVAWKLLRKDRGNGAPKREEEFLPAWRAIKGNRGRGRIKKSPD